MAVYVCCSPDIHLRTQCHPEQWYLFSPSTLTIFLLSGNGFLYAHSFTNLQGEKPSSRDLSYLEAVAVLLYSLSQLNVLHLDTCLSKRELLCGRSDTVVVNKKFAFHQYETVVHWCNHLYLVLCIVYWLIQQLSLFQAGG